MTTAKDARNRRQLARSLEDSGSSFDFVQAMRLLMRLYPDRSAIGGWDDPAREVVRLSVPPSFAFPPSEIASVELPSSADEHEATGLTSEFTNRTQARMSVRFMGLTGPQGVLPHLYTQHAAARSRVRDTAFRDFLDLFHHRALSLFHRAWERYRPFAAAEHGAEDRMRSHLLDLAGIGTSGVQKNSEVAVDTMAYYAGLLALRTRPAAGLAQMIGDHFQVPASVEQFVGEWQTLRHGGQLALGDDDLDGVLGAAVLGDAMYDPLARVRLRLGPLTYTQFQAFLPGGDAHDRLRSLARLYADDQVGVEAQLVLARGEIPSATLGSKDAPPLGFGTWLRSKPPARDADDVRLILC